MVVIFTKKRHIGIGLIGTGFMAKAHSNAYHKIPYIYNEIAAYPDLISVCSEHSARRAEETRERYGFRTAVTDYKSIIENPEIDVVDICNGDMRHKEIAVAALKAGKHVICEKPLAANAADAKEAYEQSLRCDGHAFCGYNYRFLPAVMLAKELIQSGTMGRVYSFNGVYLQDPGAYPEIPFEKIWYATGPKASCVSYGIGSHLIDMARFLVGEIEEVSGLATNYNPVRESAEGKKKVESEEDVMALVKFADGVRGTLRFAAIAAGRKNHLGFEISCSRGTLIFNLEEINYLKVFYKDSPVRQVSGFTNIDVTQLDKDHPFSNIWWKGGHGIGWEHAHINEIACFLDIIATGQNAEYAPDFYDGYRAIQIADAIKKSSETGYRLKC